MFVEVLASIFVALIIVLLLVSLLYFSEKKLLPDGDVQILINNDSEKSPTVKPGTTLLSALSTQKYPYKILLFSVKNYLQLFLLYQS